MHSKKSPQTNCARVLFFKSDVLNIPHLVSGFKCLHNVCNHHLRKKNKKCTIISWLCQIKVELTEPPECTKQYNFHRSKFEVNTYDANTLSHCVSWQILVETSAHGTAATVQSNHFTPNCSYSRLEGWFLWHGYACLCFEYVSTTFANIELTVLLLAATFNLQNDIQNTKLKFIAIANYASIH